MARTEDDLQEPHTTAELSAEELALGHDNHQDDNHLDSQSRPELGTTRVNKWVARGLASFAALGAGVVIGLASGGDKAPAEPVHAREPGVEDPNSVDTSTSVLEEGITAPTETPQPLAAPVAPTETAAPEPESTPTMESYKLKGFVEFDFTPTLAQGDNAQEVIDAVYDNQEKAVYEINAAYLPYFLQDTTTDYAQKMVDNINHSEIHYPVTIDFTVTGDTKTSDENWTITGHRKMTVGPSEGEVEERTIELVLVDLPVNPDDPASGNEQAWVIAADYPTSQ